MTGKSEKLQRQKKALKRKEKQLRRQANVIRRVGDEVHSAAQDVEGALKAAEARGRDQAYQMCKNVVDEARNITSARAKMRDLVEGVADAEA